jgi:plasmid maintenance system antidote protein VapI
MPVQPADVCQFLDRTGWSQARLAWELGINQPRISRFLNGMKKPSPDLVRVLEAFFADGARARLPVPTGDGERHTPPRP